MEMRCNYVTWTKEFSIKNIDLDRQHEIIFQVANDIFYTVHKLQQELSQQQYEEYKKELKKITIQLFNYIKTHFADEEKFMKEIGFPLFEEHRKAHIELTNRAKILLNYSSDVKKFSTELQTLINNFIIKHFVTEDMYIADFIHRALNVGEVPLNLNQYIMIKSLEKEDIYNEKTYDYVCSCSLENITKVPQSIHEELENEGKLMKCSNCGGILVFVGEDLNLKENYEQIKEKFLSIKN